MTELLDHRLERIERRLLAIEGTLGMNGGAEPPPLRMEPPPLPVAVVPPPPVIQERIPVWGDARMPVEATRVGHQKRDANSLEAMIGRHWTSWVGAIVVILGVLFFLQYNWDTIRVLFSPAVRTWSVIGLGVILAGVGEWLHRKQLRALAGIVQGIGIAVSMAACFTAHAVFSPPVFSMGAAFFGVCVIASAGIALALRTNTVALAIVAMLGAYISPIILSSGRDRSLELNVYLGALAALGWALAYLKPRWGALRWFTWSCTAIWMGMWMMRYGHRSEHRMLALCAGAYYVAGFIGEAIATLLLAMRVRDPNDESKVPAFARRLEGSLAVISMLTTAGFFAMAYVALGDLGALRSGMLAMRPIAAVALGLAAVHAMVAFATPSALFARASWMMGAALVTVAVPLALGQEAITLAWVVLALGLAVVSRGRENLGARVWMMVLMGLAIARLFTFDWFDATPRRAALEIAGQPVSGWLVMAWGLAVAAHVMGWLTARPNGMIGQVMVAAGTCVFLGASALTWSGGMLTGLMVVWLAGLVMLTWWGSDSLITSDKYGNNKEEEKTPPVPFLIPLHAGVVVLVVALKWLMADGIAEVVRDWWRAGDAWPVVNVAAVAGLGLIAVLGWMESKAAKELRAAALLAVGGLGFAWVNFETLRMIDLFSGGLADLGTAKHVALSVLWGLTGLAAVVVGFAKKQRALRYAALALLAVTLAKVLIVDMAQVKPLYRILSFLAVGGLLLCVSFVYHRQAQLKVET